MIKRFIYAMASAIAITTFPAFYASAEDTTYDISELTSEMHICEGDIIQTNSNYTGGLWLHMLMDGTYSTTRVQDYVLPCDAVVVYSKYNDIYLVAEAEKDNYIDIRDFNAGDEVNTSSYILCYDYSMNGIHAGICTERYSDMYVGEGNIEVADVNHNKKAVTLRDTSKMGDVNSDGEFAISDVVCLQKWLLGDGILNAWQNADYNKDRVVDVFDLCIMKAELLEKYSNVHTATSDEIMMLLINEPDRELTWNDLANFAYEESEDGCYIYPVENKSFQLIVKGGFDAENPSPVELQNMGRDAMDFYDVRHYALILKHESERDATSEDMQYRVKTIGEYALSMEDYDYSTIDYSDAYDVFPEEIAELWFDDSELYNEDDDNSIFVCVQFIDEHTVRIIPQEFLWATHCWIVTDGTSEYVSDDYDMEWRNGNIYYMMFN